MVESIVPPSSGSTALTQSLLSSSTLTTVPVTVQASNAATLQTILSQLIAQMTNTATTQTLSPTPRTTAITVSALLASPPTQNVQNDISISVTLQSKALHGPSPSLTITVSPPPHQPEGTAWARSLIQTLSKTFAQGQPLSLTLSLPQSEKLLLQQSTLQGTLTLPSASIGRTTKPPLPQAPVQREPALAGVSSRLTSGTTYSAIMVPGPSSSPPSPSEDKTLSYQERKAYSASNPTSPQTPPLPSEKPRYVQLTVHSIESPHKDLSEDLPLKTHLQADATSPLPTPQDKTGTQQANVIGHLPNPMGSPRPLLQMGTQILILTTPAEIENGALLTVSVQDSDADAPNNRPSLTTALWIDSDDNAPVASSAYSIFTQNPRLPQVDSELGGTLALFLHAIKNGQVDAWIGQDAAAFLAPYAFRTLPKTSDPHKSRDLSEPLQSKRQDEQGQVWNSTTFPFYDQGQLYPITLSVQQRLHDHPQPSSEPSKNQGHAVRFVIDLRLSRFGSIQIEGLSQPKNLALTFRSETPLTERECTDLKESYARILEAIGCQGSLAIQTTPIPWLTLHRDTPPIELML